MVFEGNLPRRTKYHRQVQWLTFPTRRAFDAWYELILAHGGEGAVIKSDNGEVWKRKPVTDIDAVVIGHIEGKGRHVGRLGALLVRFEDGLEMKLGGGFKDHERENPPKVGAVVKIYHQGWTSKGLPRFAQFGGERVEDTLKFNEGR
jgi:DNA ligase-1